MGVLLIHGGSSGSTDPSELTALDSQVLSGKKYIGKETDGDYSTGTLTLPTEALTSNQVLSGKKYTYVDGDTVKTVAGTMANVGKLDTTTKVRADTSGQNIILGMTNGAHITNRSTTEAYPEVQASYANVVKALGGSSAIANKIVGGQTVLGVAGTYKSEGTATASDILAGKTATVPGTSAPKKITGTMVDRGAYQYCGDIGGSKNTGYYALNQIPVGYYHVTDTSSSGWWQPEIRVKADDLLAYIKKDPNAGFDFTFGTTETASRWGNDIITDELNVPIANVYYYEGGWKYGYSDQWLRKWYNTNVPETYIGTIVHNKYNTKFVKASVTDTNGYQSGMRFGSWEDKLDLAVDVAGYNRMYVEVSNVTIGELERFRIRAAKGGTTIRTVYYVASGSEIPSDGIAGTWTTDSGTERTKLVLDVSDISAPLYFSFDRECWSSTKKYSNTFYVHKIWFS